MLKVLLTIFIFSALVGGCVTQPYDDSNLESDLDKVEQQINKLESKLTEQFANNCTDSFTALDTKIEELRKAKATTKIVERCTSPTQESSPATLDGKLLVGEVEIIRLTKESISLAARIDSGAVTSSIGIYNPRNFERDGDRWIRFSLAEDKDASVYEYPVYDVVSIKQTKDLSEERIEIKIDIEVGGQVYKNQLFNLSDRSHLDYQLLIGRSFLKDIAVIDVGSKYLLDGE